MTFTVETSLGSDRGTCRMNFNDRMRAQAAYRMAVNNAEIAAVQFKEDGVIKFGVIEGRPFEWVNGGPRYA